MTANPMRVDLSADMRRRAGIKPEDGAGADPQPAATAAGEHGGLSAADRQRIVAEERKRAADIMTACSLAGQPAQAAKFIAEDKSLSDVVAALGRPKGRP